MTGCRSSLIDLIQHTSHHSMKNICVYCGSNPGRLEAYADGARSLAKALVDRDLGLVYGGASVGIMGLIANSVLELGGRAVGVG